MTKTYEGSDALRVIADAMDSNKSPKHFEHSEGISCWKTRHNWIDLIHSIMNGAKLREVPRTKYLITDDDKKYEFPEPIRYEPSRGEKFWLLLDDLGSYRQWDNSSMYWKYLEQRQCFENQRDRDRAEKAILAALGSPLIIGE